MISKIKIPFVLLGHLLFILLVYILQAMVLPYMPIDGIVPVLLPLAVVGIATFEGAARGGGYGLFAGMLCDISFNQPVMVMTVLLTAVGIATGALSETIMARSFPSFFVFCVGALVLTSFVSMFSLLFFSSIDIAALLSTGLRQTLYSLPFCVPIYFIVHALARASSGRAGLPG